MSVDDTPNQLSIECMDAPALTLALNRQPSPWLAAQVGGVRTLEWIHTHASYNEADWASIFTTAATHNQLRTLKWLYARGRRWDLSTLERVVISGCLEVVQWLHARGLPLAGAIELAVEYGQYDLVRWLANQPAATWNSSLCALAARCGRLEVLQWLRGHGRRSNERTDVCPWTADVWEVAVASGRLAVLRWLQQSECSYVDLSAYSCSEAASCGCLDVLIWLRENGSPWNRSECLRLATPEVRVWIESQ